MMGCIYGDLLIAFPEQCRIFDVFMMIPKINGGWEVIEESKHYIRAILQHTAGRSLKENGGNLTVSSGYELWTHEEELTGLFMRIQKDTYRITGVKQWAYEGGFLKYSLEKVIGNDGTQSHSTSWNTGSHSFG